MLCLRSLLTQRLRLPFFQPSMIAHRRLQDRPRLADRGQRSGPHSAPHPHQSWPALALILNLLQARFPQLRAAPPKSFDRGMAAGVGEVPRSRENTAYARPKAPPGVKRQQAPLRTRRRELDSTAGFSPHMSPKVRRIPLVSERTPGPGFAERRQAKWTTAYE